MDGGVEGAVIGGVVGVVVVVVVVGELDDAGSFISTCLLSSGEVMPPHSSTI